MQGLQAAEDARHCLQRDARNVVERLLPRQVDARGLGVELEAPGLRVLRAEAFAGNLRPEAAPGAKLGDLLKEADRDVEKEGEA